MLKMLPHQFTLVFNVIYHYPFTAELLLLTLYFCFLLFWWDVTWICLHIFYSFQLCKNSLRWPDFSQNWRNACTCIMKKHRIVSWKRLWQYLCVCKRSLHPLTEGSQSIAVMIPVLLNKPRAAGRNGVYLLFLALSLDMRDNSVLHFPKPVESSWAQPSSRAFVPFYFH